MRSDHYQYCIVGGGPSGLTLAYKPLQSGCSVVLIERDNRTGGLAKSHTYNGQVFDTGPKRFHTDDPIVTEFLHEIMQQDVLRIGRSTMVHFLGRYFDWPLRSADLWRLPIGTGLQCVVDLLQKRSVNDQQSFHDYIRGKYGETLYRTFFEPYTRKFLRWDPADIHSDWASTGINRTVIDKRIKANTLFDLLRGLLLPEKIQTEFLYPVNGGFGSFYDKVFSICTSYPSFHAMLGDTLETIHDNGRQFSASTRNGSLSFDELIWSGNLNDLSALIDGNAVRLQYLNTVFYNITCKETGVGKNRAQWIYVSKGDSLVSRITCMKEFAPSTCAEGYYNFICELTDSQSYPKYFHSGTKYVDRVIDELVSMGFVIDRKSIEAVHVNPVLDTYPIYHRRYIQDFAGAAATVKKFSRRIHLLGRCGAFWYNNSDHSIRFAIELAQKLLGKTSDDFDYRRYFGGVAFPQEMRAIPVSCD